ncbi:MAG: TetR family transcriptional regulator [Clostridiales bacterium]|uniref:TetR/AcrR family transcriptional regulator C-terminal domain-containing protein n=1 Tax=Provencibacterium massiliense TaxID=1841868 RepID=UPI0009A7A6F1|nr:TetR/AcrR family transcriptional regulator C-terminal domain-containing protein [Provencibacterium massiliense]PWM41455.1 MAG: TetR family transcriptional regulator [Clostridiales bacterium]RGB65266.1 TetR family transcriptional regulator [Harryflintia acetispora]
MKEQDKTKYELARAIKTLMEHAELDRITVKDICAQCGLSRQTFYRNFKDKYDLVNWYFERLAQKSFKQMGVSYTLREGLLKKFCFIKAERSFFAQAFKSRDCNSILAYDYESILSLYTGIITRKTGRPLEGDVRFLLEMYCKGSIDMTVKWATTGMRQPPEEIVDLLIEAMPERLRLLLSDLQ